MSRLKDWGLRAVERTGKKLLEVADRVDEQGGEIRDSIKGRLAASQRVAQLQQGLKDWAWPVAPSESPDAPAEAPLQVKREKIVFTYGDSRKAAQVFGGRSCPWTGRAVRLLESAGIAPNHVDLDHPASGPMREELSVETGQMSVPYVYLRGTFIGGYNALDEVYRLGKLEYLALPENERGAHPDHEKFEIVKRPPSMTP